MNIRRWVAYALITSATATAFPAQTEDSLPAIQALQRQIEELDQKVKILERKRELDQDATTEKAKSAVTVSAGTSGFSINSADTNFVLKIRGYVQADARFYLNTSPGITSHDTFLLRRVRPILEGTVFEKYDYRLMLDFGSGITSTTADNGFVQDAYVNARLWPQFQIQAGKFKAPVGLERLKPDGTLLFVERSYPTQLAPNRDVGIQVQGDVFDRRLSYAAGVFNGVADGGSGDFETADDEKDFAGRLFTHPFKNSSIAAIKGFGVGVAGTVGNQEGALRTFVSPGQQRFFAYRTGVGTNATTANIVADGEHWRFSPQGYYYWGPFGLFGEYVISSQQLSRSAGGDPTLATIRNKAWQVSASYVLTGEENSFKAIVPKKPFSLSSGGWGAWELTARVGQLKVDDNAFPLYANSTTSAREATSWGVGLNWHLNRNVKLNLNYEQTDFAGDEANPFTAKGEKAILTRIQFGF
ncbi:MAG: porin [Verrucomicrobia bacterium]|nr:porin [Verrucomicrobiota bacterium]